MAEADNKQNGVYSENDTLDINELASLNQDISADFIEELQSKVSQSATKLTDKQGGTPSDDSELFEEVSANAETETPPPPKQITLDDSIDDNFVRKYRAKLNKQKMLAEEPTIDDAPKPAPVPEPEPEPEPPAPPVVEPVKEEEVKPSEADMPNEVKEEVPETTAEPPKEEAAPAAVTDEKPAPQDNEKEKPIENLTSGNIIEKPATEQDISYNESLNLLDNNVQYSKYVIYIDPENKDFIESLTVKERKNLINRIIREQDDIAITKRRLGTLQTVIKHIIVAIITVTLAIPAIYVAVNASLEATINNHRKSQSLFQTLYKEHGKVKSNTK